MGGFFFLRFICPSLLAPHVYGLLEGMRAPPFHHCLLTLQNQTRSAHIDSTETIHFSGEGLAEFVQQRPSRSQGRIYEQVE